MNRSSASRCLGGDSTRPALDVETTEGGRNVRRTRDARPATRAGTRLIFTTARSSRSRRAARRVASRRQRRVGASGAMQCSFVESRASRSGPDRRRGLAAADDPPAPSRTQASPSGLAGAESTPMHRSGASTAATYCSTHSSATSSEGGPANLVPARAAASASRGRLCSARADPGTLQLGRDRPRRPRQSGPASASACRSDSPSERLPGSGTCELENAGEAPPTLDLPAPGRRARRLRHRAAERVLREPVRRLTRRSRIRRAACVLAIRQNLAIGGRHPWALVGRSRAHAASPPTRSRYHGLDQRAKGSARRAEARRRCPSERSPARALAGCAAGRAALQLAPGERTPRAASSAGSSSTTRRRARRRISRSSSARSRCRRQSRRRSVSAHATGCAPAATLFSARALLDAHALDRAELATHHSRSSAARPSTTATACWPSSTAPMRIVVLPAKQRASLRPHGQIVHSGERLTPDEASLTSTRLDGRRVPLDAHAGPRQHQSPALDHALATSACSAPTASACSWSWTTRDFLLDEPSAFEMTPSARALDLPPRGRRARGAQPGRHRCATSCGWRSSVLKAARRFLDVESSRP